RDEIVAVVGQDKKIVDPADQVAQYTYNVLRRDDLFAESTAPVKHDYYTTREAKKFTEITRQWMNDDTIIGHHVDAHDKKWILYYLQLTIKIRLEKLKRP